MTEKGILATGQPTDKPTNQHTDLSTSWVARNTRKNNIGFIYFKTFFNLHSIQQDLIINSVLIQNNKKN